MIDSVLRQPVSPLSCAVPYLGLHCWTKSVESGRLAVKAVSPFALVAVVAITPSSQDFKRPHFRRNRPRHPHEPHYSGRQPNESHWTSLRGGPPAQYPNCVHLVFNGDKIYVAAMSSAVCMMLTVRDLKRPASQRNFSSQSFKLDTRANNGHLQTFIRRGAFCRSLRTIPPQ